MPSLDELNVDLLSEIFELIYSTSRHTIFSLIRVSSVVCKTALPFVYRECTFDFSQGSTEHPSDLARSLETLASLLERYPEPDSVIWRGVRKVVVHSSWAIWEEGKGIQYGRPSEELIRAKWASFIEFLSRVRNLREVVFNCYERVPIILLNVLEQKHPACRLHVQNWIRHSSDVKVGDPYEEALARSPCLRSIEAQFGTNTAPRMDLNQAAFERILALSPNLEAISYSIRSQWGFSQSQHATSLAEARKDLAVEHPVRKSRLKKVRWENLSPDLLQRWDLFIPLQNVEFLDFGGIQDTALMDHMGKYRTFGGLKHLSFQIRYSSRTSPMTAEAFRSALEDFLSFTCPPLQSLSIVDCHSHINIDLSPILLRHGESLRSLTLHQVERKGCARSILTREELSLLRTKAPHLERFTLDVNRTIDSGSNESEIYRALASFPNLQHLTIYFDLGTRHKAFEGEDIRTEADKMDADLFHQIYTEIDEEFAKEVWRAVRGKELEEVVLYDGEPKREVEFVYPWCWASPRERSQLQRFSIRANERDDSKDEITVVRYGRAMQKPPPGTSVPNA
ncbi:hypothetical protein V5O48_010880 [Marasmius crinis-equi]|uniref:F-box domain-containing protein n=1 Tax=Marasmius crinis-equi TaxID=585013 RepID=A0ABR3F747_9AGAR